jgi:hypothetical protein
MGKYRQAALQFAELPIKVSVVHTTLSLQCDGQDDDGSQVSLASTVPLPQLAEQSLSLALLHPDGQQPSPGAQRVMGWWEQAILQVLALPVSKSMVQAMPSLQEVGQEAGGSQVSPGSRVPLPQWGEQSSSVALLQPAGQQPSPLAQAVMGSCWQAESQVVGLPLRVSRVH